MKNITIIYGINIYYMYTMFSSKEIIINKSVMLEHNARPALTIVVRLVGYLYVVIAPTSPARRRARTYLSFYRLY